MSKPLQQRNTRSLLTWLPLLMLAGFIFLYALLRAHVRHMEEKQLEVKQQNVWNALSAAHGAFNSHLNGEYDLVSGGTAAAGGDTHPRDTVLGSELAYITRSYNLGNIPYRLTTYTSIREYNHLLVKVLLAEALIFLLLLAGIVFINRRASRRLWAPFYHTLEALGRYDIRQNKALALAGRTGTMEFDRLNHTLTAVIHQVNHAYQSQKQFTENAAHELQTPLAIIRSKVELLMGDPGLTEDMAQLLGEITEANERLSQMNKNLLLLTKIDNRQYPEFQTIALSDLLARLVGHYREEAVEALLIRDSIQPGVRLKANPALIEILLNNLLRNAVVHNVPDGYVDVRLTAGELVVENSGPVLQGDTAQLFERFRKGSEESRTTGLGLALVSQICQLYQYTIQYQHWQGVHSLRLSFAGSAF